MLSFVSRPRAIATGIRIVSVLGAVFLGACQSGAYGVEVTFTRPGTRDAARAIELSLVEGGCDAIADATSPSSALQRRVLRRGGSRASFDPAPPGRYAVHALARDAECAVIADGCTETELVAGGSDTIRVMLDDTAGAACSGCDDGACGQLADGGVDASTADGGVRDGGRADAGMDAAVPDAAVPDATVPDAAVPDAGPRDSGVDGGPSSLCPLLPDAIFCDGFETATPTAPAPWSTVYESADSELSVVTSPVAFGRSASRSRVSTPREEATFSRNIAVGEGELWVRLFVHVPSGSAVDGLGIVYLQGGTEDGVALQLRTGGRLDVWVGVEPSTVLPGSGATVPLGRWACVEMHVTATDSDGAVSLYVDGAPAATHGGRDMLPDGGFRELMVGIENTSDAQEPATVFVDEVALSRSRPGC